MTQFERPQYFVDPGPEPVEEKAKLRPGRVGRTGRDRGGSDPASEALPERTELSRPTPELSSGADTDISRALSGEVNLDGEPDVKIGDKTPAAAHFLAALNGTTEASRTTLIGDLIQLSEYPPGTIHHQGDSAIALSKEAVRLIKIDSDYARALIDERTGRVIGQDRYDEASECLNEMERLGRRMMANFNPGATNRSGKVVISAQNFQFREARREYKIQVKEFERLTGHTVELRADLRMESGQAAGAIDQQHYLAREALVSAITLEQKSFIAEQAGVAGPASGRFAWVDSDKVRAYLTKNPDKEHLFESKKTAAGQEGRMRDLFGSGKLDRAGLDPENGVIGRDGQPLAVGDQIKLATDGQFRRAILEGKGHTELSRSFSRTDLRKMQSVVLLYGTHVEREVLEGHFEQEREARVEAARAEKQAKQAAKQEELLRAVSRMGPNSSMRASVMRNPENRQRLTEMALENNPRFQSQQAIKAELAAERAQREVDRAENQRRILDEQRDIREMLNVDMSHKYVEADIRLHAANELLALQQKEQQAWENGNGSLRSEDLDKIEEVQEVLSRIDSGEKIATDSIPNYVLERRNNVRAEVNDAIGEFREALDKSAKEERAEVLREMQRKVRQLAPEQFATALSLMAQEYNQEESRSDGLILIYAELLKVENEQKQRGR